MPSALNICTFLYDMDAAVIGNKKWLFDAYSCRFSLFVIKINTINFSITRLASHALRAAPQAVRPTSPKPRVFCNSAKRLPDACNARFANKTHAEINIRMTKDNDRVTSLITSGDRLRKREMGKRAWREAFLYFTVTYPGPYA